MFITTEHSAQSILMAIIFQKLTGSKNMTIVYKENLPDNQKQVAISDYNHEALLHEYERREGKLSLLHDDIREWSQLEDTVATLFESTKVQSTYEAVSRIIESAMAPEKNWKKLHKELHILRRRASSATPSFSLLHPFNISPLFQTTFRDSITQAA